MIIISHRGYWKSVKEKNTLEAFKRSFQLGFGVETDVRDFDGRLVISHDPSNSDCLSLEHFFSLYRKHSFCSKLALNIKSDGLQLHIKDLLNNYGIENYFLFDMSVPDGLLYLNNNMVVLTRQSEYEKLPSYYELADGLWIDEFHGHWVTDEIIENHLENGKVVCLVSPELHNRDYLSEWSHYKSIEKKIGKNIMMICTDYPEEAEEFFNA